MRLHLKRLSSLLLVIVLPACAGNSASEAVYSTPGGAAFWIEGPDPEVQTLLLSPAPVGLVEAPGVPGARLSIGAFFTRYDSPNGQLDQLALLVELVGEQPMEFISFEPSLLLDIDGIMLHRAPGVSGNSLLRDETPEGPRARMVIPISTRELRSLAEAERVRGRVGLWGSFAFSEATRARLLSVLGEMPDDASVDGQVTSDLPIQYRGLTKS